MVSSITDGKFATLLPPQETCTSGSALFKAQDSNQHSSGQEFISLTNVGNAAIEGSVLCPNHVAFPVADQISSSATPDTDSHSGKRKSWLQDKQLARSLRYMPNWSYVTQRSLPPREIPRCHANAKEWPDLGSRTEELEVRNYHSVSNSRVRVKPRFRNLYASSSCSRQDLKPVQVEKINAVLYRKCDNKVSEGIRGASCEPKLVMLNKDFIVTSPVRENLLVTIALTSPRRGEDQLELAVKGPSHILIGRFTAFSSFSRFKLCQDALRVKFEQNAGGSSTISEVYSSRGCTVLNL